MTCIALAYDTLIRTADKFQTNCKEARKYEALHETLAKHYCCYDNVFLAAKLRPEAPIGKQILGGFIPNPS